MKRAAFPASLVVACAGCLGGVQGEVDGEPTPAMQSGHFVVMDAGDDILVTALLFSFPDSCETLAAWQEARNDAVDRFNAVVEPQIIIPGLPPAGDVSGAVDQLADDLEEADEEHLPDEAQWMFVSIRDDEDDIEGEDYDIDRDGRARFGLCRRDEQVDWHDALEGDRSSLADCFDAEDGTLQMGAFDADEGAAGRGDAELEEDDGDDAGDVTFDFSVAHCEEHEDAIDDAPAIVLSGLPIDVL
jgi:hypothetical protein